MHHSRGCPGVIWEIWEKEEYGAMNQSLVFKTEKVTERITRIYAFATELMYLVEGTEKAVLIDTGSGIGSLKACVEQLTDKPVIVLVTHGHVDHAMGAAEFENVYMSHEDDYIYENMVRMRSEEAVFPRSRRLLRLGKRT